MNIVVYGILAWMCLVSTFVGLGLSSSAKNDLTFYTFGPHEKLVIMGVVIDTYAKYASVVMFCLLNSMVRSVETDILYAWLLHNVQDTSTEKTTEVKRLAYGVAVVHSTYYWWDWFVYMNILLSQCDLFLVEMAASIFTSIATTHAYLHKDKMVRYSTCPTLDPTMP